MLHLACYWTHHRENMHGELHVLYKDWSPEEEELREESTRRSSIQGDLNTTDGRDVSRCLDEKLT